MNYEQFALDYLEGTLDDKTQLLMEHFLSENKDIKAELDDMALFALEANTSIIFEDKAALIQTAPVRQMSWWKYAAAAVVLIGIGFGIAQMMDKDIDSSPTLVEESQPTVIEKVPVQEDVAPLEQIAESSSPVLETPTEPIEKEIVSPKQTVSTKKVIQKPVYKSSPNTIYISKSIASNEVKTEENKTQIKPIIEDQIIPKNKIENTIAQSVSPTAPKKEVIEDDFKKEALHLIEQKEAIASIEPLELDSALPEIQLESNTNAKAIAAVEIKTPSSRLQKMGLVPEGKRRKFNLKKIREALLPEAIAEAD